jgi:hypothetical protein
MAPPERLELSTSGFEVHHSIQLSYGGIYTIILACSFYYIWGTLIGSRSCSIEGEVEKTMKR